MLKKTKTDSEEQSSTLSTPLMISLTTCSWSHAHPCSWVFFTLVHIYHQNRSRDDPESSSCPLFCPNGRKCGLPGFLLDLPWAHWYDTVWHGMAWHVPCKGARDRHLLCAPQGGLRKRETQIYSILGRLRYCWQWSAFPVKSMWTLHSFSTAVWWNVVVKACKVSI